MNASKTRVIVDISRRLMPRPLSAMVRIYLELFFLYIEHHFEKLDATGDLIWSLFSKCINISLPISTEEEKGNKYYSAL